MFLFFCFFYNPNDLFLFAAVNVHERTGGMPDVRVIVSCSFSFDLSCQNEWGLV